MAGIKLGLASSSTRKALTRKVEFRHKGDPIDPGSGPISHDGEGDLVFTAELEHLDNRQINEITQAAAKRKMISAKKKDRGLVTDWQDTLEAICKRSLRGWTMTIGACHKLETVGIDYAAIKPEEAVEFSPENIADLVRASTLGALVYNCITDFNYWFPNEREQVGNSGSGPAGSTAS